jgi:hypothetical protein
MDVFKNVPSRKAESAAEKAESAKKGDRVCKNRCRVLIALLESSRAQKSPLNSPTLR